MEPDGSPNDTHSPPLPRMLSSSSVLLRPSSYCAFFFFFFFLSLSLLIGWQLSIWICCRPLRFHCRKSESVLLKVLLCCAAFFLLGDSTASEIYVLTFGTLCSIFIGGVCNPSMKVEQTECSETSVHTIQTPGNHPKERMRHSEHIESLKSRNVSIISSLFLTF